MLTDPETLRGVRILLCVAHQDDESLYFGGFLTAVRGTALRIVSMTTPDFRRPDAMTRMGSFVRVCETVGAGYALYDIRNFRHDTPEEQACVFQYDSGVEYVASELQRFRPDVVLTHGPAGEPCAPYPGGHVMHKFVYRCVARAVTARGAGARLLTCATLVGGGEQLPDYDREAKKRLLDFYLPHWEPLAAGYHFCYGPESFEEEQPCAPSS